MGDATGEMGPFKSERDLDGAYRNKSSWYNDYLFFVSSSSPWFLRGGDWRLGNEAGSFSSREYTGEVIKEMLVSYRIVLAPTK